MAVRILTLVWDKYPGGGTDLLALLALADWSDDEGRCWPSIAAISTKIRLSRSQAQRVVHGLIDDGFVKVIGNNDGGAKGASRKYQINLERLRGSAHATGSVDATGSTHAQEGSHPCANRGSAHATQTVIEPSLTVKKVSPNKKPAITLKQFLEACKASGEKTIPENDPVFEYARTIGLPVDFIFLGWQAFKAKQDADKLQKDWRKTFRNYVRNPDWLGVWKLNREGEFYLTDAGKQIEREFSGAAA